MSQRALLLEAHHATRPQLTLDQAARLWSGEAVAPANRDDVGELSNYPEAFDLVSAYLDGGEPVTEALIGEITGGWSRACAARLRSPGVTVPPGTTSSTAVHARRFTPRATGAPRDVDRRTRSLPVASVTIRRRLFGTPLAWPPSCR